MDSSLPLPSFLESIWNQHHAFPSLNLDHPVVLMKVLNELDETHLTKAFPILLKRHPAFRIKITDDKKLVPCPYHHQMSEGLRIIHCTGIKIGNWDSLFKKARDQLFDFVAPPLIKVTYFKSSPFGDLLLIVAHHICVDLFSMEKIVYELDEIIYQIVRDEKSSEFEDSFWDDVLTILNKQKQISCEPLNSRLDFPEDFFPGLNILEEVNFHPSKSKKSSAENDISFSLQRYQVAKGARHFFEINKSNISKSPELPFKSSIFMAAAWSFLVSRITGKKELAIGMPFTTHPSPKNRNSIGCFTRILPLTLTINGDTNIFDLAGQIERSFFRNMKRRMYEQPQHSFDVRFSFQQLHENRTHGHVSFSLNCLGKPIDLKQLRIQSLPMEADYTTIKLGLFLAETKEAFYGTVHYNASLFAKATIKKWVSYFETICREFSESPEKHLSAVRLCKSKCSKGRTQVSLPDENLSSAFQRIVKQTPERIAISGSTLQWTYREIDQLSEQIAQNFAALSVGKGDRIALALQQNEWFVPVILGILKVGAIYVPLDIKNPAARLKLILDRVSASQVVVDSDSATILKGITVNLLQLEDLQKEQGAGVRRIQADISRDNTAYILFTSGSTGVPKGVQVSHGNVLQLIKHTEGIVSRNDKDVWSVLHSFAFDYSVWEMWCPLLSGGRAHIMSDIQKLDIKELIKTLQKEKITTLSLTPSHFYTLIYAIQNGQEALKYLKIRTIILGGEKLNLDKLKPWFDLETSVKIINMLGMTEATVHSTYMEVIPSLVRSKDYGYPSLIGKPLPGHHIRILDDKGEVAPETLPGEIVVEGPGVSKGYWRDPDGTREKFIDLANGTRAYKTGDIGRLRSDGMLEFIGRKDGQVKLNGFRIELGELESILANITGSSEIVATESEGKIIIFIIRNKSHSSKTTSEYKGLLTRYIPQYMMPHRVVEVDHIPKTGNGKVDLDTLLEAVPLQLPSIADPEDEPGLSIIAGLWQNVLNTNVTDFDTNFFDLGGDSLKLAELKVSLEKELGKELDILSLYKYSSVRSMAEFVGVREESAKRSKLSLEQTYLYFQNRFNPGDTTYHLSLALKLSDDVHLDILDKALDHLQETFDVLTSVVVSEHNELFFKPQTKSTFEKQTIPGNTVYTQLKRRHKEPFSLKTQPPVRWTLFAVETPLPGSSAASHIILITFHHIAVDVRSVEILLRHFFAFPDHKSLPASSIKFSPEDQNMTNEELFPLLKDFDPLVEKEPESFWCKEPADFEERDGAETLFVPLPDGFLTMLEKKMASFAITLNDGLVALCFKALIPSLNRTPVLIGNPRSKRNDEEKQAVGFFHQVPLFLLQSTHADTLEEIIDEIKKWKQKHHRHIPPFPRVSELFMQKTRKPLPMHITISYHNDLQESFSFFSEDESFERATANGSYSLYKHLLNKPICDLMITFLQRSKENGFTLFYKKNMLGDEQLNNIKNSILTELKQFRLSN